jgi:hypothetical protein
VGTFATLPAIGKVARMHWFRARRVATWLALFALACQLALTFGHVHLEWSDARSHALVAALDADAHSAVPASSPPNKPENRIGDLCAICASIGLASALLLPDAPAAAPATSCVRTSSRVSPAAPEHASCDHVLFDARGPPRA